MGMTTRKYSPTPEDFKDVKGRWRTKSLFVELNTDEIKYPSIFTLEGHDKDGRVSMKAIYMKANDPTEYNAAMVIFGSYDCWENLCKAPFFQVHVNAWRKELTQQIRSQAVETIGFIAAGSKATAAQLSAAKWLASQEWNGQKPKSNKVGRPIKVPDPETALKEGLLSVEEEDEDYARIIEE